MLKRLSNALKYQAAGDRVITTGRRAATAKYSPDQPRDNIGRWIDWIRSESNPERTAGLWNELNRAKCDAQFDRDMFQCSFVASGRFRSACDNQAMTRRTTCMKDDPVPPLIYFSDAR